MRLTPLVGMFFFAGASVSALEVQNVVSGGAAPVFRIAGGNGTAKLLLNGATGDKDAAVSVLELEAGAEVPEHAHDRSAEMLYLEQGAVEMRIGGKALSASAGDAVYIPAGVRHSAKVIGEKTVRAVQVYVGPGPEQRFTQGAKVR